MNYFFGLYKDVLPTLDGYITDTRLLRRAEAKKEGEATDKESENESEDEDEDEEPRERMLIHFDRLEAFLAKLAGKEEEIINRRVAQVRLPSIDFRSHYIVTEHLGSTPPTSTHAEDSGLQEEEGQPQEAPVRSHSQATEGGGADRRSAVGRCGPRFVKHAHRYRRRQTGPRRRAATGALPQFAFAFVC